ncbi:hypothetical protein D8674_005943 [Pyrus ussuriensis x Pyrus communis]|uniref:Uncharacterized protein n=1 Tax=Pyrus ussuriensis x Pyrus communis TaxID=2448454 RepID=A0A5N5FSV5_9ROSA|nr:hypothetical protein D8674_005943 [Pyrus ussuriensis x Pyrus communis]
MPSVTWGVVQGRKEKLVSRVIICDYLKSLGIVPDELENLELSSTVEVMSFLLLLNDQRFEERLQGEYIETETPGPSFCMGGKLELLGSEMGSNEEDESDDEVLYRCIVSL